MNLTMGNIIDNYAFGTRYKKLQLKVKEIDEFVINQKIEILKEAQ